MRHLKQHNNNQQNYKKLPNQKETRNAGMSCTFNQNTEVVLNPQNQSSAPEVNRHGNTEYYILLAVQMTWSHPSLAQFN